MRLTRLNLAIIMVLCALAITLVAAVSLYIGGSHDWAYDYDSTAGEKCVQCHVDVEAEILAMPAGSPHRALYVANNCSVCHYNATAGFDGTANHSGILPECTFCHEDTEPERDGDAAYGIQNLTSATEAHNQMYVDASGSDHDPGKNEACLSCHSQVNTTVVFNRPQWYNFTIDDTWSITNVDTGPTYEGGNYTINFTTADLGKHSWVDYRSCTGTEGCHQDVQYSRMGGVSGGHHSDVDGDHENSDDCLTCHWGEDPTKDYHAARVVSCTYTGAGCHDSITSTNMTDMFTDMDANLDKNQKGDLCWGCHAGYDWMDAGAGLTLQVETERNYNVSYWNGAWQQVYPDPAISCQSCHDDTLAAVPPIPAWSGKYVDHSTAGNYDYGAGGSTGCLNCHDEGWSPHDNPHEIQVTYNDYLGTMGADNTFCDQACHYSILDWRPSHGSPGDFRSTTQVVMEDAANVFNNFGGKHRSPLVGWFDGDCANDCHTEHLSIPTCTDCHDGTTILDHDLPTGTGSPWGAPAMYNVDAIYVDASGEEIITEGIPYAGTYIHTQADDDVWRIIREKNNGAVSSEEVFAAGPQATGGVFVADYSGLAGASPGDTDDPINDGNYQTMDETTAAGSSTSTYATSAASSETINTGAVATGALSDTETDNNNAGHRDIDEQDSGQTQNAGSELAGGIYATSANTYAATDTDDATYHTLTEDMEYDYIDTEFLASGTGVSGTVADLQDTGSNYRVVDEQDLGSAGSNDWGWATNTNVVSGSLSGGFLASIDDAGTDDAASGTITETDVGGAPATTNELIESFEGAWPGVWTATGGWDNTPANNGAFEGTVAAEHDGAQADGILTSPVIDLSGATSFDLTTYIFRGGCDANEVWLQYRDSSNNWDNILDASTLTNNQWNRYDEATRNSDAQYLHANFQFRFNSVGMASNEDVTIDWTFVNKTAGAGVSYEYDVSLDVTSVLDPATQAASTLYVNTTTVDETGEVTWYLYDYITPGWVAQTALVDGVSTATVDLKANPQYFNGADNVTVRFVNSGDPTDASTLVLTDVTVYSYVAPSVDYRTVVLYNVTNPVATSNYYLTVIADSQGGTDEDYAVEIDGNDDGTWLNIGTITGSAGYVTLNRGPADWGAEEPTTGTPFQVRFTDQTSSPDNNQNTLSIDTIELLAYESPNLQVGYEFTFSPVPSGTFDLYYDARYSGSASENMNIWLYDFDTTTWDNQGWAFTGDGTWEAQTRSGLGNEYISAGGLVHVRFEDGTNDQTDATQGTLDVDYLYVQTPTSNNINVEYNLGENDGDDITTWAQNTYTLYFQARVAGGTETFDIDYRVDGATWQNFGTISGGAWGGGNDLSTTVTPVDGEFVEIRILDNGADDATTNQIEIDYIYLNGDTPAGGNTIRADYVFDFAATPPGNVDAWINAYFDDADVGDDVWIWAYDFDNTASWVNQTTSLSNGVLGLINLNLGPDYVNNPTGEVYLSFRDEAGNDNSNTGTLYLEYMNCSYSAAGNQYDLDVTYVLGPVVNAANYNLYLYGSTNNSAGEDFTAVYRVNAGGDSALASMTTTTDTSANVAVGALGAGDYVFVNITDDDGDDTNQYAARIDFLALVEQSASTPISNAQCQYCHNATAHNPRRVSFDDFITAYGEDSIDNAFCEQTCHESATDNVYAGSADHAAAKATFDADASTHKSSTTLDGGGDSNVECSDCHVDHNLAESPLTCLTITSCHEVVGAQTDGAIKRQIGGWLGTDHSGMAGDTNLECMVCHDGGPHDPEPSGGACHGNAGNCWDMDTNAHPRHIDNILTTPDYNYNCSDCHYNAAGTYDSTYDTGQHMDTNLQVVFNTTGIAGGLGFGAPIAPTYNASNLLDCTNTYCHSDGRNTSFTFPGVDPKWNVPGSVSCGVCHLETPTTDSHSIHVGNNIPNANPNYGFECSECHYDSGSNAAGYWDTTYGSSLHVNGKVDVVFNSSANGMATYGGTIGTTNYAWSTKTCSDVYCHSNGNPAGFVFTDPAAWNAAAGSISCGDCHGMPNYNDGTDRELGGTTTGNSASHLKHTRNFGGAWGATRNLAYIDNNGDGSFTSGEVVISDNDGTYLLDPDRLNGVASPDEVITAGLADITRFDVNDDVYWGDDGDGVYEFGEDLSFDMDGDGTHWEAGERLHNGASGATGWTQVGADADAYQYLAYLDADHDGNYDGRGGFKETIIIKSTDGGSTLQTITDATEQLSTSHMVLQYYTPITAGTTWGDGAGITNYDGAPWWDVYFTWYDYDCSECHYNNPPTAGMGTYGTSQHVDANSQVFASIDPASISDQFNWAGTNPTYTAASQTCTNTWCHSNAIEDNSDSVLGVGAATADWADAPTAPDWDNPNVACGDCHGAVVGMYTGAGTDGVHQPDSYPHVTGAHEDAEEGDMWDVDNDGNFAENGEVPCRTCHYLVDRPDYEPYGTGLHVDGLYFTPVSGTPRMLLYPGSNPSGTAGTYPDWECHKSDFA